MFQTNERKLDNYAASSFSRIFFSVVDHVRPYVQPPVHHYHLTYHGIREVGAKGGGYATARKLPGIDYDCTTPCNSTTRACIIKLLVLHTQQY